MKFVVVFLLLGLACVFYTVTAPFLLVRLILGSSAVAFSGVGLAYAFIGPRVFLKSASGRLSPLSYLLFWPHHLLNRLSLLAFRRGGRENAFDQITDNVYLGCQLAESDKAAVARAGIVSVLDLTCEFSETPALRCLAYRSIPVLDTRPPSWDQLTAGAKWIKERSAYGPVYVHCALGHGRSALFVAAYLLLTGEAGTASEAIDKVKARRPSIGLHPEQTVFLERWAERKATVGG